jgi:hypothetical protein
MSNFFISTLFFSVLFFSKDNSNCFLKIEQLNIELEVKDNHINIIKGDINSLKKWTESNERVKIAKFLAINSNCFKFMEISEFYSFFGAPNLSESNKSKDYAFEKNLWDDSVYYGSSLSIIIEDNQIMELLFINR